MPVRLLLHFISILLLVIIFVQSNAHGQKSDSDHDENDTLSSKDKHPQDLSEETGFFIRSKDNESSLRIYGSARLYGSYDFNGLNGGIGFKLSEIPVKENDKNERTFFMSANLTRFGFEAKKKTIAVLGGVLVKVEADFNGSDNRFRIRQAYGQSKFLIVGQTWTAFSDIETLPNTVDIDGPPTAVSSRTVQVKYYLDFDPGWRFRLSVESPSVSVSIPDSVSVDPVSQNYPAISANIKKDWKSVHLKTAAIINPVAVRNLAGERNSLFGYGALLSLNVFLAKRTDFKFQWLYGEGIASFLNLSGNAAYDVILKPDEEKYQLTSCYGGFAALTQSFLKGKLEVNIIFGSVDFKMEEYFPDDSFKSGKYLGVNGFLITDGGFKLGMEYTYGFKKVKDGDHGNANRTAFTFYYDF